MEHPRIDLAHEGDFVIGDLHVHPSTRELARGHDRLVVEPRVMQVLVALYRAEGAVVSKDDLAHSCWEGRVVGEDAINRVLSRLRKVSETIGTDAFHIETVTRVGYRLIVDGKAAGKSGDLPRAAAQTGFDRRNILAAAGVALVGASGAMYLFNRKPRVPSELATMIGSAETAMNYYTPEQSAAAVGLLKEATRLYPERSEGWAKLAVAYHTQVTNIRRDDAASLIELSSAAARRALELDPGNADAGVVLQVNPGLWFSTYMDHYKRCREALRRFPDHWVAQRANAAFFFEIGRMRESIENSAPLVAGSTPSPIAMAMRSFALWSSGRPDEAEALLDKGIARWPRHAAVWFNRARFYIHSDRVEKAEAMLADLNGRPVGLPESEFELIRAEANAMRTGDADAATEAIKLYDAAISTNVFRAESAAIFASSAQLVNVAFEKLDRYYFSADAVEAVRHIVPAGYAHAHSGRMTFFLHMPPMAAVRAAPQFATVVRRIGLEGFWKKSGLMPDYLS